LSGVSEEMFPQGVTSRVTAANSQQMESGLQENVVPRQSFADLDRWMERYQQADPDAPATLVGALSPALLRFFKSQVATREQADDLLQQTWLRFTAFGTRTVLGSQSCLGYMPLHGGCAWTATAGRDASGCTRLRWRFCRSPRSRPRVDARVPRSTHLSQPYPKRNGKW
jgi:hypothetical protein